MASDIRLASREAKFSAAFVRLGLTGTCAALLAVGWLAVRAVGNRSRCPAHLPNALPHPQFT